MLSLAPVVAEQRSTQRPDAPQAQQTAAAQASTREVAPAVEQKPSQTSHAIRLDGRDIKFTATAGTLPIRLDDGKVAARMFFVAYTRDRVEQNRELRYTYSRTADPPRLVVQVRFIERGDRLTATFVYEPTKPNEATAPQPAAKAARDGLAGLPPAVRAPGLNPPAAATAPPAPVSAATRPVGAPGPDAALKGLNALGVVVEDLSQQAASCGLSQAPLEASVSKSLSDAGITALRNSDEDSYLYVQVMTTATPSGLCVSRYDVYLYTHANAPLPYQPSPVLVQVELLHRGGPTGGSAATHGDAVGRSVKQVAHKFAARIRAAGK